MREKEIYWLQPNKAAVLPRLRFYDPEVQDAWNEDGVDQRRRSRANARAQKLLTAYRRYLRTLAGRLSKQTYGKFSQHRDPLFDSNLLRFTVGDAVSASQSAPTRRIHFETSIEARFLNFEMDAIHVLRYRGVTTLKMNIPEVRWYKWEFGTAKDIDCLLAHELTSVNPRLLRHSFLFASGAYIEITCAKVTWKTHK